MSYRYLFFFFLIS